MLSEEEKKAIEQAISSVTRGVDIESAILILEKCALDGLVITGGRINIFKIAVRQIVEFLKEYKDKGYLDVVREKVKANETVEKQSKEIEELKEENEKYKNPPFFDEENYISKEESEQKERKAYIKGTNDADELCNKKWENKIKAKIEELDEEIKVKREIAKNPMDRVSGRLLTDSIVELEKTKKVLQSLLEKE